MTVSKSQDADYIIMAPKLPCSYEGAYTIGAAADKDKGHMHLQIPVPLAEYLK